MSYKVIKSKRKTITMSVERDGTVIIRAPLNAGKKFIDEFYNENLPWVQARQEEHRRNAASGTALTAEEIKQLKVKAKIALTIKTAYFAAVMGVQCNGVKITSAKSRWGSCKRDGSICYSYRTMLLSERCQDYIVVHELCHILQFNHSPAFWEQVGRILPDYKDIQEEIKQFSNYDLY